jgi:flagellar M-ring protein FliF
MADTALAGLRQARSITELPVVRQLGLIAALALAIAAGIALFSWSQSPNFQPLFSNLTEKDSAELADAMRAAGIEVRIDPNTGAVLVPAEKIHDARMRAAAQGLPRSTSMGFEMIQQDEGFGTSQFMENARYQLALETELARTVASLQPVKNARVHLALPKPSAFTQNSGTPSASVLVELQPGRSLESNQVESIQHMVASSVPNLSASNVTVIDQFGRLLSDGDKDSELAVSAEQYQYARRAENDYARRIEEILTPMLGPGHITAQVAADFDFSVTEEAKESYNPQQKEAAVRSEQSTEDTTRAPNGGPLGIPGATSNQPPATAAPPAKPAPSVAAAAAGAGAAPPANGTTAAKAEDVTVSQSKSETRNYELDRTVSHTRQSVGRLKRLSVAVLVDNLSKTNDNGDVVSEPLTPEQIAKVEALVKKAVGFDETRGDTVTVQNAPFQAEEVPEVEPIPWWKRPELREYLRQGLGALIVLVLIFAVLRPTLRSLLAPKAFPGGGAVNAQLAERGDAQAAEALPAAGGQTALAPPPYEQKIALARNAVAQDPKRVAQVVKTWIGEDGG